MTDESFKDWLLREYLQVPIHAYHILAVDILQKWPDFPDDSNKTQLELEIWLSDHGACSACLSCFADAWKNYINDKGSPLVLQQENG